MMRNTKEGDKNDIKLSSSENLNLRKEDWKLMGETRHAKDTLNGKSGNHKRLVIYGDLKQKPSNNGMDVSIEHLNIVRVWGP